MKRHLLILLALLLSAATLAPGCADEKKLTQVILLIDTTDYAVPGEIDWVEIYLHTATTTNPTPVAQDDLTDGSTATLGFVLESDTRLTDYVLEAEFYIGANAIPVVIQRAVFDFQPATTRTLEMKLHAACAGVDCCGIGDGGSCTEIETCDAAGACVSADYDFGASAAPLVSYEEDLVD